MTERKKLTLAQKIQQLQGFTKALLDLQKKVHQKQFLSDEILRRGIERYLQLSLEAVLDISNTIINEESLEKPNEYKDAILILGQAGILPKKFAEKFAPAAGFRNILVHDYVQLDVKKVFAHFKQDAKDIEIFLKHILKYLKQQ
ncbi:hypothetical protein COV82_02635 [Candidatus Peregrinibacteria bacterium CG11_big_fil_rev_8_21_14_0_20_46_8]|nr:MAG: hypothetical protein COV82_02635 [Candidatus Peregrinibacteria bacterium CG11_big_fil_rev_8_21_14_0_20_46_8]